MSYARCILLLLGLAIGSLEANSNIYEPLNPPNAREIVAFTNSPAPSQGHRQVATREDVLTFLRQGKNNLDVSSWYKLENFRRASDAAEGVIVDRKGQFYFWFLRAPKVLTLETSDGRMALLQLP